MADRFNSDSETALQEQLCVSRETLERLKIYQALLVQWQQKTNLVAPSTLDDFWQRHIADSLQCHWLYPEKVRWSDIGTGGGFPGMVIAITLAENPDSNITLIDSNQKKCAFLRTVLRETGARALVVCKRIEQFVAADNGPDIVTARAVASLDSLLQLCEPWLMDKTVGLFHKGRDFRQELQEAHGRWRFDLIIHPSRNSEDSVILEIARLRQRDTGL